MKAIHRKRLPHVWLKTANRKKRKVHPSVYEELKVFISDAYNGGRTKTLTFRSKPPISIQELAERISKAVR